MSLKTLETLCLNKIAIFMWHVYKIPIHLCVMANLAAAAMKEYNYNFRVVIKYCKKDFQESVEIVLNRIMTDNNWPYKLKIKIALRLISLEEDVSRSILDLTSRLKRPNIHNIMYCVANAVIRDNKLDRAQTLRSILFNSYFSVEFNTRNIMKFCIIDSEDFEDLFFYLCRTKRLTNSVKIQKRVRKMSSKIDNLEFVWLTDVIKAYESNWLNPRFVKKQLLDYLAVNAPLEILEHKYNKLKKSKRQYAVSRALISALLCDNDVKENIIFLFTKLTKETKIIIFMRFHENIFRKLFMSCYGDFCHEVFTEIYKRDKFYMCQTILRRALCCLTSMRDNYYYDVLYTNGKDIFYNMWKMFPASIKSKFVGEFHNLLDMLTDKEHFNLLSTLLADPAFSDQQQIEQRVYIMSQLVLKSSYVDDTEEFKDAKQILEELEKEYPDANVAWMKNNMDCELLKQIILTVDDERPYFNALKIFFETETAEKYLKDTLLTDNAFMQKAICRISQCGEESIKEFLKWIFNDDKIAINNYVQKTVIPCIVEIYKIYLLNSNSIPYSFPFSDLNVSREDQENLKATVREDEELIRKMFKKWMSSRPCNILSLDILPDLLKSIYNDDVLDSEKETLLEDYLISENGLSFIYQMFESDFYSVRLYVNNEFADKINCYCAFSKMWLQDNPRLINALSNALNQRGHPNSLQKTNKVNVEEFLLPFENEISNRVIVDANYRMFRTIIKLETQNLTAIFSGITADSKKITSLTEYSIDFARRWPFQTFPVVIS